jgi:hypothetical protein
MNKQDTITAIDNHKALVLAAREAAAAVEANEKAIRGYMESKNLRTLAGKSASAKFVEGRAKNELDVVALRKQVGDAEFLAVATVTQTAASARFGKSFLEPFVKCVGRSADQFKID